MENGTVDTNNGTIGGGDILQYFDKGKDKATWYVDYYLEKAFVLLPYIRIAIMLLICFTVIVAIMRMNNINHFGIGRGIKKELKNIRALKERDKAILRRTNALKALTNLVEHTMFRVDRSKAEYLEYNIRRAGFMAPGGYRTMTAEEYNAVNKCILGVALLMCAAVCVLHSIAIGIFCAGGAVIACTTLPNIMLRSIVMGKDAEIRKHFSDMYLMVHYTLISGGRTPLDRVLRSYGRTTTSQEMVRFVNNCCNRIETYGEYKATSYISRDYREVPEVVKMMRIVRQLREGADVHNDLVGFRDEVITSRSVALSAAGDKLVAKADRSMVLIWIVLIQAILSALAIYIPDLGMTL